MSGKRPKALEDGRMIVYHCQRCNKQMRECPDGSGLFCEECMIFRDFKHFEKGGRMKRYAAFESMTGDSKFFDTIEDAERWLIETWQHGATDLEVEGGFIAEVLYHGRTENKLVKYEGDGE
jgi:DNA-directed RNA polymerase subunit RPC12/RpoP